MCHQASLRTSLIHIFSGWTWTQNSVAITMLCIRGRWHLTWVLLLGNFSAALARAPNDAHLYYGWTNPGIHMQTSLGENDYLIDRPYLNIWIEKFNFETANRLILWKPTGVSRSIENKSFRYLKTLCQCLCLRG